MHAVSHLILDHLDHFPVRQRTTGALDEYGFIQSTADGIQVKIYREHFHAVQKLYRGELKELENYRQATVINGVTYHSTRTRLHSRQVQCITLKHLEPVAAYLVKHRDHPQFQRLRKWMEADESLLSELAEVAIDAYVQARLNDEHLEAQPLPELF